MSIINTTIDTPLNITIDTPLNITIDTPLNITIDTIKNTTIDTPLNITIDTMKNTTIDTPLNITIDTIKNTTIDTIKNTITIYQILDALLNILDYKLIIKLMACNKTLKFEILKKLNPSNISNVFIITDLYTICRYDNIYFQKCYKFELLTIYNRYMNTKYTNQSINLDTLNEIILYTMPNIYDNNQRIQDIKFLVFLGADIDTIDLEYLNIIHKIIQKSLDITIPFVIKHIGKKIFNNLQLNSVIIPDSVITIDTHAFANNKLTTIILPDSIKQIGDYAFYNNLLTNIYISNTLVTISKYCFCNNKLSCVIIPDSVKLINSNAFYNNTIHQVNLKRHVALSDNTFTRPNSLLQCINNKIVNNPSDCNYSTKVCYI